MDPVDAFREPRQERRQPVNVYLNVRVEENQNLKCKQVKLNKQAIDKIALIKLN